jgi:hypothetical protein
VRTLLAAALLLAVFGSPSRSFCPGARFTIGSTWSVVGPHMSAVVPSAQTHAASTQVWFAAHGMPHAEQFASSRATSTHTPPHSTRPAGHATAHPIWLLHSSAESVSHGVAIPPHGVPNTVRVASQSHWYHASHVASVG